MKDAFNIVCIHSHDTGRYIQPYGCNIQSPNLMKLAEEGLLFRNAYCAAPNCSPSRSAMFTGMSPHSCGMLGFAHRGFRLHDYSCHLVSLLNQYGYDTVLSGFQHEAMETAKIGYRQVLHVRDEPEADGEAYKAWDIENAKRAAEYIKRQKGTPFFLSYGMLSAHRPFPETAEEVNPDYVMAPFPIYDHPENRRDMAAFVSSVKVADYCTGIVLAAIQEAGKEKQTLVMYTTDHGIPFPGMKSHLYDAGIGVAMIWKCPGIIKAGKVTDELVSHIDVFPTLCDAIGMERPPWLEGTSFYPILRGDTGKIRDELFAEVTFHSSYDPMRCIRTERYKLIKCFGPSPRTIHLGGDGGISQTFVEAHGISSHKSRDAVMLFDLYLDPVERVNVAQEGHYKEICDVLSNRLYAWMRDTDDPLLQGTVEPPAGARIDFPKM